MLFSTIKRFLLSEYLVALLCLAYFVAMIPLIGRGWYSAYNLNNILEAALPLLIIALGQMFVMISAGIDLSVTGIVAMTSVLGASFMSQDIGVLAGNSFAAPIGIVLMLSVGAGIGAINGASVTLARMPSFMVTLATSMFFSGLAIWYSNWFITRFAEGEDESSSIAGLPSSFLALWEMGAWWITLAVVLISFLLLNYSLFGASLFAVGLNTKAAGVSGVKVRSTIFYAYVICGLFASVGAILFSSKLMTGSPLSEVELLDVIGATVIGGTSLFGGKGRVSWTCFGVLLLVLIDTSLPMIGTLHLPDVSILESATIEFDSDMTMICKGVVILFAASLDALRNRWQGDN